MNIHKGNVKNHFKLYNNIGIDIMNGEKSQMKIESNHRSLFATKTRVR